MTPLRTLELFAGAGTNFVASAIVARACHRHAHPLSLSRARVAPLLVVWRQGALTVSYAPAMPTTRVTTTTC